MSYLALARKWRPRTFAELVGQEPVRLALSNALNQQRLHHAYLFTGLHGTGKTSLARIVAKAFNCEQGISATPCLTCDTCLAIEEGRFMDLIEVDAASNTRVEEMRELLDNLLYLPSKARFKVYIIDEVHMLSQHSFNALLKTLEEPPSHVKFILATTDPQKLPVTVLSRCLQFHLKPLASPLINTQLQTILQAEHLTYEEEATLCIAKAASGSMRDALSILDQAIVSCDKHLDLATVKLLLGYTQQDYALQVLQALAKRDAAGLCAVTEAISTEGGHYHYVLDSLLQHIHDMSLYQSLSETNPFIKPEAPLIDLSTQFSGEDLQLFYHMALQGAEELSLAPTQAIGFTMILLRMHSFRPSPIIDTPPRPYIAASKPQEALESKPKEEPSQSTQSDSLDPTTHWMAFITALPLTGLALQALNNTTCTTFSGSKMILCVAHAHQALFTAPTKKRIESVLSDHYQRPITIELKAEDSLDNTPMLQQKQVSEERLQQAEAAIQSDPLLHQLTKDFSAELVKNSIVPLKDSL